MMYVFLLLLRYLISTPKDVKFFSDRSAGIVGTVRLPFFAVVVLTSSDLVTQGQLSHSQKKKVSI